MNLNKEEMFIFFIIFMIFQYVLMFIEWKDYSKMIGECRLNKFNFYLNEKNQLTFKNIFLYSLGYAIFTIYIYYFGYIKKSYLEVFIFIFVLYATWDGVFLFCFNQGIYNLSILLFDIIIVGCFSLVSVKYLMINKYSLLKKYLPFFIVLYIFTMGMFYYKNFQLNPFSFSDIKGYVLV